MGDSALHQLDRRGFLAATACAFTASAGSAIGQTLIEDTPTAGVGFQRQFATVQAPALASEPARAMASSQATDSPTNDVGGQGSSGAPQVDWRSLLLAGERSLLLRRDGGPAQRVRYCNSDGMMDRNGYAAACHVLRDVRANKLFPMDPHLLDILCGLQRWAEFHGRATTVNVLSGFRTVATNASLEGAAQKSMHLVGRAADIVLEGLPSSVLGAMVKAFNVQGGTGIYVNRGFVHVDTGARRTWVSKAASKRR